MFLHVSVTYKVNQVLRTMTENQLFGGTHYSHCEGMLLVRDVTFSLRRTQGKASSGAGASESVAGALPGSFVQLSRNLVVLASLLVCSYDIQLPSIFPSARFRYSARNLHQR